MTKLTNIWEDSSKNLLTSNGTGLGIFISFLLCFICASEMSFRIVLIHYAIFFVLFQSSSRAATHDELSQCGTTGVYKRRQTLLQSPNYPDNYSPNTCLDYVIRSPFRCPTKFHVQFLDFLLESSPNCTNDYLAIGLENDGDDMDLLCGEIVGIRKYHTPDGVLRLRFFADDSPWTTAKGFKILITRLACEREDFLRSNIDPDEDRTEEIIEPAPQLSPPQKTLSAFFRNLSLQDQHVPYFRPPLFDLNHYDQLPNYLLQQPPPGFSGINSQPQLPQQTPFQIPQTDASSGKPCTSTDFDVRGSEALQVQQLPSTSDQFSDWQSRKILKSQSSTPGSVNHHKQQQINSPFAFGAAEPCCASSFAQKRFYLSSPGFPRTAFTSLLSTQQRDCQFQLQKSSPSVCRLRIVFKFFDFGQTYSGTGARQGNIEVAIGTSKDVCTEDYIQIDEERFCGCRTGYVFNTIWGIGNKMIRMRIGYSGIPSSGFLLDIFQEDCTGLPNVASQLSSGEHSINPAQSARPEGTPIIGLLQHNGIAQRPNAITPFDQQQNNLNLLGVNGKQSLINNQQPQQFYSNYQQNGQQFYPQNNPFWLPPQQQQQQSPFIYPMQRFRSTRNLNFVKAENTHQPVSVVETNSTRKEYYYFDGDEVFGRAHIPDEPNDPNKVVNTNYAALRGRCSFDAMDALRLSGDHNWIMKPTCYAPQGRWFSNLSG